MTIPNNLRNTTGWDDNAKAQDISRNTKPGSKIRYQIMRDTKLAFRLEVERHDRHNWDNLRQLLMQGIREGHK